MVGGPHISVLQQEFFRECPELDFGIVGEGETAFSGLVKRLEEGKDPWEVPGLVGPEKRNPPGNFIDDLDSVPFPARHLLPNHAYRYALWPGKRITTMITSRGCPYLAFFATSPSSAPNGGREAPDNVLDEMEQIVKDFKIRSIILYDDLFTLNKQRVIEICQGILERGLRIEWKCEGRVDRVDEEMLRWMKKAGCSLIAYGVESGNQIGLDYLQKKTTLSQIRQAFELTHKAGIRPMAYFILGIPVETFEQGLKTIEFARELKPEYAQFSILSPYKGTRLYEEAKTKGWYREVEANNPFDKDQKRPVLLSENWSEERLREILRQAHQRFYFRGGYILNRLRGVKSLREIRSLGGVGCGLLRWYFSTGRLPMTGELLQREQYAKGGIGRWYWDYRDRADPFLHRGGERIFWTWDAGRELPWRRSFANFPDRNVLGIDSAEEKVRICKKHHLPARQGSAYALDLEDHSWDCCLLLEVIEHLLEPQKALREIHRVLRKGGLLLLIFPHDWLFKVARLSFLKFKEAFSPSGPCKTVDSRGNASDLGRKLVLKSRRRSACLSVSGGAASIASW